MGIPWFQKLSLLKDDNNHEIQEYFIDKLLKILPAHNTPYISVTQTITENDFINYSTEQEDAELWEYLFISICKIPTQELKTWKIQLFKRIININDLHLSISAWKILPYMFDTFSEEMNYILENDE